jgi:hypothetical protein
LNSWTSSYFFGKKAAKFWLGCRDRHWVFNKNKLFRSSSRRPKTVQRCYVSGADFGKGNAKQRAVSASKSAVLSLHKQRKEVHRQTKERREVAQQRKEIQ